MSHEDYQLDAGHLWVSYIRESPAVLCVAVRRPNKVRRRMSYKRRFQIHPGGTIPYPGTWITMCQRSEHWGWSSRPGPSGRFDVSNHANTSQLTPSKRLRNASMFQDPAATPSMTNHRPSNPLRLPLPPSAPPAIQLTVTLEPSRNLTRPRESSERARLDFLGSHTAAHLLQTFEFSIS